MSLWRFNNFEAEVDLTDADFIDKLHEAQKLLDEDSRKIPIVGKNSDILRSQVKCFKNFFDNVFYQGAGEEITEGRNSLELCLRAVDSLAKFSDKEDKRIEEDYGQYVPQNNGNRQQRRQYDRQNSRNYNRNHGGRRNY